jgi:phage repressor protein C with HTH and peptisase S24 domain
MNDMTRDRLRQAMKDKGFSPARLALACGFGRTYLHDFLSGRIRSLTATNLQKVATALAVTTGWLLGETESPLMRTGAREAGETRDAPGPRDLPLMGAAAGALAGSMALSGDPVDWLRRPAGIANRRDVYALYVTGSSMEPRFFSGDLVFVDPHRPARPGDVVIVQTKDHAEGATQAWIKLFVRAKSSGLVFRQYNPAAEIEWKPGFVAAMHRVLTMAEVAGA